MATNNKSTPDVDGRTSAAGSSEMLLDFAVSHAPAIFYVASRLGDRPLVFISSNVFDILGYTQEEYLSDSSFGRRLIHPDDLDEYNRSVDGLAETKRASLEYRFRDSSGEYRWFRDEQRYVDDNDKEEFVGCMIDFTGQKEAEGRVSDAEALTATITSATLDALITIESDGCILEFNPAAENIFGYRRDEAVGKNLSELIIPEKHQAAHMKGLADFRYNSRLRHYDRRMEIEARRADGSQFPVELTVSHAALGGRDVLIGSVRDITDRVKSEEERQRLSRLLQDAVESLPHGFSILNEDGIIEAVNSSYAESYGRTVNETIGMDQDENLPAFIAMCQRFDGREVRACPEDITFIKGRMLTSMEIPVEAEMKSGAWWLLVQSNTSEGGYVTLRTDITRQKQAEAAIMESSDMIRRILEACPHPVVMTRLSDGLVIYESPASQQLYGREHIKTDVYSTDIYVNKDDRALYVKQLRKFGQVDGMELKLRQTGGREFWASVSARKIEYQGIECIVASAWDMTESLALDGELTRQREALHQSEKLSALGELLAGVAHELNNPLSVLVGQALLLQETTTDEKIMTRAKKIGNAADRCARIVKTFLAMARQQPMNRRNTQINDVIESALEMTAYGVRSAGIKITTRMAQKLPPVWVDPDQINQVVTNLIVNAQHALGGAEGEKRVHVSSSYRAKDNEVVIKVTDTGPGIPPDIQARIFEPFYTTKEVGVGTGIGLAFCHRIMEFRGGRIKVTSSAEGTTFVVRIPAEAGCAPIAQPDTTCVQGIDCLSVLVIDDEPEVTDILAEILMTDGHRVVTAENGNRALTYLSNDSFDVILSDMRMPELDGPNFYRVLGERFPEMANRIAFITGDTMSPKVAGFLKTCGCPSLEKPITPTDVRGIIDDIVGGLPSAQPADGS